MRWLKQRASDVWNEPRIAGCMRLAFFTWSVSAVFAVASLPVARAGLESSVRHTGSELLRQVGPLVAGPPRGILINGQRLFTSSRVTDLPPDQVLSLFEKHCHESATTIGDDLAKLPGVAAAHLPENLADPRRWLSVRADVKDGAPGEVACIVPGKAAGTVRGMIERLGSFASSGNVSDLGDIRYVVVRRGETATKTHVLAVWSEGEFSIPSMFPESGDAPGSDPADAARPRNSRRVLSAALESTPYAMRMYDASGTEEATLADYDTDMAARGWARQPFVDDEGVLAEAARQYVKDMSVVFVTATPTPEGKAGITVLELGSKGFATAEVHSP